MPLKIDFPEMPGVFLISNDIHADVRGYLVETFKKSIFAVNSLPTEFKQDLLSSSGKGVIRGLHYQIPPQAQDKLVSVLNGSIYDVVVDLRRDLPTFGKWKAFQLKSADAQSLWVPHGFAHGFQSLEDNTIVSYKLTEEYSAEKQHGIIWNDPFLKIKWPLKKVLISDRDSNHPFFSTAINFSAEEWI